MSNEEKQPINPSDSNDPEVLRKQLKQAEKNLTSLSRTRPLANSAAAIVHDIRNSLGIISSTAQFVLSKLNPPQREKEAWQLVERNVESIKKILKGYLGLARQTESAKEPSSINEIIHRVCHFIETQTKKQNITVQKNLEASLPPLELDVSSVESAILNLSINALEAMGKNGTLNFTTQLKKHQALNQAPVELIILEIEDNGPGIPADILDKIFTPFYTTKEQGTGMGLYSAKATVSQNSGKITCESQPGKTKMTLSFSVGSGTKKPPSKT